jgi:hypothetical protein
MTIGAAMAINVDVTLDRKPESLLIALVTTLSEVPKRPESTRLPPEINGEFASETLLASCDNVAPPDPFGARSNIVRSVPGSSALLARPPSTAAIDD